MKKLLTIALSSIFILLIAPSISWACPNCTFEIFEYVFPFLPIWIGLYSVWFLIHLGWYLGTLLFKWKPPTIKIVTLIGGFALFTIIMFLTLFLPIIFVWTYYIFKNIWKTIRNSAETLHTINRKTELYFNVVFASLMIISIPIMYWYYNQPKQLISRFGLHNFSSSIHARMKAKGPKAIPYLRKALEDGINHSSDFTKVYRAAPAASILGDLKDTGSIDLLLKGSLSTSKEENIHLPRLLQEQCVKSLVKIGGDEVIEKLIGLLESTSSESKALIFDTLRKITGQNIDNSPNKWQEWWKNKSQK